MFRLFLATLHGIPSSQVWCRILYETVPVYREQLLVSLGTLPNNVSRVEFSNVFDSVILFTSLERRALIGQEITNYAR